MTPKRAGFEIVVPGPDPYRGARKVNDADAGEHQRPSDASETGPYLAKLSNPSNPIRAIAQV